MNMKKIIATNLIIVSTIGAVLMTPNLAKAEFDYKDALYIQPNADWEKDFDIDFILRGEWRYKKCVTNARYLTDAEIESYMQQVYDNPAEADRREAEYLRFHNENIDVQLYRYDRAKGYIINNKTEERLVDEEARQAAEQAAAQSVPTQTEEGNSNDYQVPTNDVVDSQASTDNLDTSLVTNNFEKEDVSLETETESIETETGEENESTEEISEENIEDTAPKKEEKKKSKNPIVRAAQGVGDVFVTLGNSIIHFFGGIGKAISNIF